MNSKEGAILVGVIILVCVLITAGLVAGTYNGMISSENAVDKAWSDVEASYQRRLDVIPSFVETAEFSIEFQLELATEYAKSRECISQAANSNDPDALQRNADAEFDKLEISVRAEAVPEAKTEQLTELNSAIDNVERVVNHERKAFNDAVRDYNNAIETIPGVWFSGGWGFQERVGFTSEEGADQFPDFNLGD